MTCKLVVRSSFYLVCHAIIHTQLLVFYNYCGFLFCLCYVYVHIVGFLPDVGSLTVTPMDSIISLTWTPPFSLDLHNVDPDISGYCVGVVNSTSSLVIHSQCGITDTQYNYTVSPRSTPCDTYTFTVTPVNTVGNGTSASVTLQSSITEGEIYHIIIISYIMIQLLLAPQPVESGDLEDVVAMVNSILFCFEEVSLIAI